MKRNMFFKIAIIFVVILPVIASVNSLGFDLDPGGGGEPQYYQTTFHIVVRDSKTDLYLEGVLVKIYYGSSCLGYGYTNGVGQFSFTVTDTGSLTYKFQTTLNRYPLTTVYQTSLPSGGSKVFTAYMNKYERNAVMIGYPPDVGHAYVALLKGLFENSLGFDNIVFYNCYSSPTKAEVRASVQLMANNADSNDLICFISNTHGGRSFYKNCYIGLANGDKYKDNELRDDLKNTAANQVFVCIDACYSGGFKEDFQFSGNDNFLVFMSCKYNEEAHAPGFTNWLQSHWINLVDDQNRNPDLDYTIFDYVCRNHCGGIPQIMDGDESHLFYIPPRD
jgi:hypothetical protein